MKNIFLKNRTYLLFAVALIISSTGFSQKICKAARKNKIETVKELVNSGANVNETDKYGRTALHYAADGGYLEIAKYLLSNGANINGNNGATPLYFAVSRKKVEVVKYLLEQGADCNKGIDYGYTSTIPIREAYSLEWDEKTKEIITLLKKYGAKIPVKLKSIYEIEEGVTTKSVIRYSFGSEYMTLKTGSTTNSIHYFSNGTLFVEYDSKNIVISYRFERK